MNDNVRVLGAVFLPEEKLREEIREVVRQYNGRISYAQLLGILEMLKFEYMQDGYIGEE
jgi:hypothetical protein